MAFLSSRRGRGKRAAGPRRRTTHLALERLEDRSVPSGYQQIDLVGYQPGVAPLWVPKTSSAGAST